MSMIDLDVIQDARRRILPHILATPLIHSPTLSDICGVPVSLKHEHHQADRQVQVTPCDECDPQAHQIPTETGAGCCLDRNHGRALSYAARAAGSRATICMSRLVPENTTLEIRRREIMEGAGAVGVAALLAHKVSSLRGPVALVLSGRNIDMNLHRRVVNRVSNPFGQEF